MKYWRKILTVYVGKWNSLCSCCVYKHVLFFYYIFLIICGNSCRRSVRLCPKRKPDASLQVTFHRRYQFKHSPHLHQVLDQVLYQVLPQERERERQLCGGERKRKRVRGNGGEREIANAACTWACSRAYQMVVVRRWKKVGRLRERRRRPKASRIPPGTVPKYRTELARPHCRIRLSACQVYSASHLENVHSGSECLVADFAARERVSISTIVTLSEESPQPYIIDLENRFPALGTKSTFTC